MSKINPNLFVGVNSIDAQTPSKKSPAKGEGQLVAGMDRLQLGTEKVSAAEAVGILVERITSHIREAMGEAIGELGQGPPVEVPPEPSPEAISQRIFNSALGSFEKFQASHPTMSEAEARERFAELMGEAIDRGVSEARSLLQGLKVLLSGGLANKVENVRSLLAEMLDEFVAEGLKGAPTEGRFLEPSSAGTQAPPPEHGQSTGLAAQGAEKGTGKSDVTAGNGPSRLLGDGSDGAQTPPEKVPGKGMVNFGAGMARNQIGTKQLSAEQINRVLAESIVLNMKEVMGETMVESGQAPLSGLPADPSPEAAAQRIFDLALSLFDGFKENLPALSESEAREHFAGLLDGAVNRGLSEARNFFDSLKIMLSGEAAGNMDKVKNLFTKMMEEFVAQGLKDPSAKAFIADPSSARSSAALAEQGLGAGLIRAEDPASGSSLPLGRSPSTAQAQIIPPESTVLAMAKRALLKKVYASGKQRVGLQKGVSQPSLAALLGTLFGIAVLINYPWELAQMVLYQWWDTPWTVGLFTCFRAALGDGLLVLALYGIGCALFRNREWVLQPGASGYTFLALSGMAIAVAVEWHATAWNRWTYNTLMPLIPVLGVGLFPVLQMTLLPPFVAHLARLWLIRPKHIGT